jgi:hypothetical protein
MMRFFVALPLEIFMFFVWHPMYASVVVRIFQSGSLRSHGGFCCAIWSKIFQ